MVGQNIGKYRILDRIGRGGMGTVYRAIDETLHRDVAIKVLNAELNDPGVARRFKAEAVTVARLSHPGIATIFELFQHEGQWLMVMEFLRGETLDALVTRKGPLDVEEAARLCMQSLNALAHAHSLGVVHRDLKPANIMLIESGSIKIMDFGIARVAGTEHLTNAGFLMGTPAFMAPEQVTGGEVDARADLYAMGVVLFYLLTAHLPFKGDTPFEMVQSRMVSPPIPIATFRDGLPQWVAQVLDLAMTREPHGRLQSAPLFHEALRRGLANLPIETGESQAIPPELIATAMPNTMPAVGPPPPATPTPASTASVNIPIAPTPTATRAPMPVPAAASTPPTAAAPTSSPAAPTRAAAAAALTPPMTTSSASATTMAAGASLASSPTATAPGTAVPASAAPAGASPQRSTNAVLWIVGAAVATAITAGGIWWWRAHRGVVTPPATIADAGAPAGGPPTSAAPVENATPTPPPPPDPGAPPAGAATPPNPAGAVASSLPGGQPTTAASGAGDAGASTTAGVAGIPARGRGRGAPTNDPLLAFSHVRFITIAGKKTDEVDATVNFAAGHITAVSKDGATLADLPYRDLMAATYTRARTPKWDATLASPPDGTDFPTNLLRLSRHWLVLQSRSSFIVLRLSDDDWRHMIETVTARTGLNVSQGGD